MTKPISIPKAILCGAGMGLADAVPGVSGGTVLLVAGILDAYLAALAACLAVVRRPFDGLRWRAALEAARLLGPLVVAQVLFLALGLRLLVGAKPELGDTAESATAALIAADGLLVNAHTAPVVFAIFFGLVAVTVAEPLRARRTRAGVDWMLGAVGAVIAGGLALMPASGGTPGLPMMVFGGALAITVMILPGISGSLVLLLLGLYQPVAGAVHDRDLVTIGAFGGGILLGLAVAVPLLRALLGIAHDRTMAFLAGLMLGSLVALWPWKTHAYPGAIQLLGPMWPLAPFGSWWWPVLAAVVAAAVGILALRLVNRRSSSSATPQDWLEEPV